MEPLAVVCVDRDGHATPEWHPEAPDRVPSAAAGIADAGLDAGTVRLEARLATLDELARAHSELYLDALRRFCAAGGGEIDPDTVAVPASWDTARRTAGAVLEAIDAVRSGIAGAAVTIGRPPGHHATRSKAMGFCLVNNVAVGAATLAEAGERVVVFDWDVHHGNGTQQIFWDDPRVLYVSIHQSPLYPGTGRADETGGPAAPGSTVNLPLPEGTTGDTVRALLDEVVSPVVERFAPTWLLISAGFDGHRDDPLAGWRLTAGDYADFTARATAWMPPGRTVLTLEGGYDLGALRRSFGAAAATLAGQPWRPEPASSGPVDHRVLDAARVRWTAHR
jgi:acetoin utilization deacetylase AcuC-like enzyme